MIEICALGGYSEVGRNSTAIKIDDEVIILDLGIHLDNFIAYTEDEEMKINGDDLIRCNAAPDINMIDEWKDKVKAIIPSHAHLDHIGAIPYLADKIKAPIICTPFTGNVIKAICKDEKIKVKNKIINLNANSSHKISPSIKIEFVNITHSTPQTVVIAIHTRKGIILYANDFKLDNTPTLGKKPDIEKFRQLGNNCLCLIIDSLYADKQTKTPSEAVAKQMLMDILLTVRSNKNAIIVTTFASHIARLKSIIEFGKKLNRKVMFMGRSLAKYTEAAEQANIVTFSKDVEIVKYGNKVKRKLKTVQSKRNKFLLVVTGHQGEPQSALVRMANGSFDFKEEDIVIFSSGIIPTRLNVENREYLENKLKERKVRIFKDIHVSGHAAREDMRDFIKLVRPQHLIPTHGGEDKRSAMANLAKEMGFDDKQVHLLENGSRVNL